MYDPIIISNAGKSTLMRALTGSEVLVANKLFATLDTSVRTLYPESIPRPDDVAKLHKAILAFFQKNLVEAELFLPWSAQQLRGEIFARCEVLEERADEEGAFFRVRGEQGALDGLREQIGHAT